MEFVFLRTILTVGDQLTLVPTAAIAERRDLSRMGWFNIQQPTIGSVGLC
ncbi:MAG: hypothetical protein HOF01_07005 [Chloroflexi bacterium]|nr:hypothetical protein [Chloroflexota bacterium]